MTALLRCVVVLAMILSPTGAAVQSYADTPPESRPAKSEPFPPGWEPAAQRDEIRPAFSFDSKGGPKGNGAFVIVAADSVGQHGRFQKSFPITGGKFYQFQ